MKSYNYFFLGISACEICYLHPDKHVGFLIFHKLLRFIHNKEKKTHVKGLCIDSKMGNDNCSWYNHPENKPVMEYYDYVKNRKGSGNFLHVSP